MINSTEVFATLVDDMDVSRQVLLAEQRFSVVPELGRFVIFVAGRGVRGYSEADYKIFMNEAERWQAEVTAQGSYSSVQITEHAKTGNVIGAVKDPEVAGMTFIGHGTLGEFWTENGSRIVDWKAIAQATDHLKRGEIWQATCGHIPSDRGMVAPLATAVMEQLSRLHAAPGQVLPDEQIDYNVVLRSVFDDQRPLLEQLLELNTRFSGTKTVIDAHGRGIATKPC